MLIASCLVGDPKDNEDILYENYDYARFAIVTMVAIITIVNVGWFEMRQLFTQKWQYF